MNKELLKQFFNLIEEMPPIPSHDIDALLNEITIKLKSTNDPVAGKKSISTNVSLFRIAVMNMGDGKHSNEEVYEFCQNILKQLKQPVFNGVHLRSKFQLLQELEYLYIKGCADMLIAYMESELPQIKEPYWKKRYRDLISQLEEDSIRYQILRTMGDL